MLITIRPTQQDLRKFGITFSILLLGAALYLLLVKHHFVAGWLAAAASPLFLLCGLFAREPLRPIYIAWMSLAFALGWINTRIILLAVFYLIVTPVGLLMRLLGKDPLGMKADPLRTSYWVMKAPQEFSQARYEQLF